MDHVQSWIDSNEVRRMAESLMAPAPQVDQSAVDAGYGEEFEGFANAATTSGEKKPPQQQPTTMQQAIRQAQQVTPSAEPAPPAEASMDRAESALALAKKTAEASGMLDSAAPPVPQVDSSPFQVDQDQSESSTVPVAEHASAPAPKVAPPAAPEPPAPPVAPKQAWSPATENVQEPPHGKREVHGDRGPFLARLENFSAIIRRDLGVQAIFLIDSEGKILIDEIGNTKLVQVARTLANASYIASRQTPGEAAVGNLHVRISSNTTLEVVPVKSQYGMLILGAVVPAPLGTQRVSQLADFLFQTVEPN